MKKNIWYILLVFSLWSACQSSQEKPSLDLSNTEWSAIVEQAKGSDLHFMMWQGSPEINHYILEFVKPRLKANYDIELNVIGGQGPEIVQLMMGEKQANVESGQVDMVWINGETFFQLRQIQGLWGPFVESLPNAQYVDFEDPFISIDFQQPVNYMECPWTISQFAMVYDSAKISNPPTNLDELKTYVQEYPGTFTISNDFSGMTLLKSFLAEISGSSQGLNGPFNEDNYLEWSGKLWDFIEEIRPYLWKAGSTFPKEQTKMDQMFANGEIYLGFGFGEGAIDDKIHQGLFPNTTRAYPWANGTIKNTNYLGIAYNAPNKEAALVAINYMLSPEAQLQKADPKGMDANTVLDIDQLPDEWKTKFQNITRREYGISMNDMKEYAIQEPDPRYMIRLYEDFRKYIIEN
ncbi:ABC transporter substrate-binding protein [Membranihabitans marinus]|uniref:ABC transporter substrate-binding protein n=1 Tax=Membranihabitans marinus TaxID=1227546 RepID=UPI001F29F851|nr:ABC transporter substrate-binding protein [Membranihabitans marinus]